MDNLHAALEYVGTTAARAESKQLRFEGVELVDTRTSHWREVNDLAKESSVRYVKPIDCQTLTSVVSLLEAEAPEGALVHVESFRSVRLVGPPHPVTRARDVFLRSSVTELDKMGSTWLEIDDFVRLALGRFMLTDSLRSILKIFDGHTLQSSRTVSDDGISQQVEVKTGALKTWKDVPNPIHLAPRSTFPEILKSEAPPMKAYVFRLGTADGKSVASLTPADGHAWETECTWKIGEYLRLRVPESVHVLC